MYMKAFAKGVRFVLRFICMILTIAVFAGTCLVPSKSRAKEDLTADFVDYIYGTILDKEADSERFGYWYWHLKDSSTTAVGLIDMLTQSYDFYRKNYTPEQTIDVLSQTMTGKPADDTTKQTYVYYLNCGISIRRYLADMAVTPEFAQICAQYQIEPGTITDLDSRDINPEMTNFVKVLFEQMYGRAPVTEEYNIWCQYFTEGKELAPTLMDIVKSSEFTSRCLSDESTIDVLSSVMLGRTADPSEKEAYLGMLDSGLSMTYVASQIASDPNYLSNCSSVGIRPGTVTLTEARDKNPELTSFLTRLYTQFAGKRPSAEDLNSYVSETLEDSGKTRDAIVEMLSNPESMTLFATDDEYLNAVFDVCYGQAAAPEKIEAYKIGLKNGVTRERVLESILSDPAFDAKMSEYGIDTKVEKKVPEKVVALTFDDGPYTDVTMRILDALEPYGAHATFFVVGNRVNNYKECIVRAVNLGCQIGDHTWNHTTLTRISGDAVSTQINDCADAVYNLTGIRPVVMRPVGGSYNSTVSANVGMPMIIWSIDTNDWKYKDSDHVINEVLNNVRDGDIVLMHDLYETTATAVETIVPALIDAGFTLVTIDELAEYKNVQMENGKAYFSIRG